LQRSTVKHGSTGLFVVFLSQSQHSSQVTHDGFKHACLKPPLGLLRDKRPRGQIMVDHPPLGSCTHHPTQPVEHFLQGVLTLRRVFTHQRQVGSHKTPFFIAHSAGVCISFHPQSVPNGAKPWEREQAIMLDNLILSCHSSKIHNRL
jgi:hypothetical protein